MKIDELSPELEEKIKACKTTEEFAAILKTEGIELDEGQLEALSGGRKHMCYSMDDCGLYVWDD